VQNASNTDKDDVQICDTIALFLHFWVIFSNFQKWVE